MAKDTLFFPDINQVLCCKKRKTMKEVEDEYRNLLLTTGTVYNIQYANKLLEYQTMLHPSKLAPFNKDFNQYLRHMQSWKKQKGYNFSIQVQRRKKSYIKLNEKIRLFLKEDLKQCLTDDMPDKFSLERIRDIIGIRLILCLGRYDNQESVKLTYDFLNETIYFFTVIKGYNIFDAEPKVTLGFDPKQYPQVTIPNENCKITKGYERYVKDYYKSPKKNAYQSLHMVVNSLYGQPFEIQVRTFATHVRVEYCSSLHHHHDNERYSERISLSREFINIYGYDYVCDVIEDFVGLEKAIDPFNMLY